MEEHDEYDYGNDGPTAQGAFLYCFIPTLCMMFDASFIIVGMICLVGADGDFDKCSGDRAFAFAPVPLALAPIIFRCMLVCLVIGVSSETWSDNELTENEIAGKVAGPPCMCQKAPLSASAMLLIGLVMLVITRIPPYLNRDKHMLKLVRFPARSSSGSTRDCVGTLD